MGVEMKADFLSQSERKARARRDFPGDGRYIFVPKDPRIDPVVSWQRTQQAVEGALST